MVPKLQLIPRGLCKVSFRGLFKMADDGVPTTSELKKFKVVELKAKLQEFGLPVNGKFFKTNIFVQCVSLRLEDLYLLFSMTLENVHFVCRLVDKSYLACILLKPFLYFIMSSLVSFRREYDMKSFILTFITIVCNLLFLKLRFSSLVVLFSFFGTW